MCDMFLESNISTLIASAELLSVTMNQLVYLRISLETSLKRFKGASIVDETSREVMQYSHERVAGLERRS